VKETLQYIILSEYTTLMIFCANVGVIYYQMGRNVLKQHSLMAAERQWVVISKRLAYQSNFGAALNDFHPIRIRCADYFQRLVFWIHRVLLKERLISPEIGGYQQMGATTPVITFGTNPDILKGQSRIHREIAANCRY
jgi:hypothetical protein